MERFSLKRPRKKTEKTLILLDKKNCGYIKLNEENRYQIYFSVNYVNRPGFRFLGIKLPNFASEEKCLAHLNEYTEQMCLAHNFHFFTDFPSEEELAKYAPPKDFLK